MYKVKLRCEEEDMSAILVIFMSALIGERRTEELMWMPCLPEPDQVWLQAEGLGDGAISRRAVRRHELTFGTLRHPNAQEQ
jgi:hypothetical protein